MKKIFTTFFIIGFLCITSTAFAQTIDKCKALYKDRKYHSAANCYYYKIQENPNEPSLRFWYAASLYYDRQLNQSLYQYDFIANKYKGTNIGDYASKEAQKVRQKIEKVKNAKINDNGTYLEDLQNTYRWPKQPIKVWFQPSNYNKTVRNAFSEWQTKTYGAVKFNYYHIENEGDLKVYFVDTLTCSEFDDALACTSVKTNHSNKILSAKIEVLQKTKSGQMCSDRQLYHVILHEIGHALGIYGHSKNHNDIMYERDSSYDVHLSQKDINTIRAIYGK